MSVIADIIQGAIDTTSNFKPADKITLAAVAGSESSQRLNFLADHSFWFMSYGDWITVILATIAVITFFTSIGLFKAIKRIWRKRFD